MPVSIKGSGGGSVTLDAGAAAADTTLTIPNVTGTVLQSGTAVTVAQGGTGLTSPGTAGNVLTSTGSAWASSAPAASGFSNMQVFTSTGTFTVPTGVTKVKVTVVGAGGGGGGTRGLGIYNIFGGGGGGGGASVKIVSGLTPAGTVAVTVGTGGAGGTGAVNGSTGGTSSFGAYCSASAGGGGFYASDNICNIVYGSSTGPGGSGSSGDFNTKGGTVGLNPIAGQSGAASQFGGATPPITGSSQNGVTGSSYGGGGSGAVNISTNSSQTGGTGGSGIVIVEY